MGIVTKLFPLGGNTAPTQNEGFVFEIETSSPSQSFGVGTTAVASQIDWGDGNVENFEAGVTATHRYTTPGTYIIYYRPTEYKIRPNFFSSAYPGMVTRYLTPLPQCVETDGTPSITINNTFTGFHRELKQVPNDFFKNNTQIQNLLCFFEWSKLPAIPDGIFDGLVNLRKVGGLFKSSNIQRVLCPPFTKEKHPNLTHISYIFGDCIQLTDVCDYLFYTLDGLANIDEVFYHTINLESIPPHTFSGNNNISSCYNAFAESGIKSFDQTEPMFKNIGARDSFPGLFYGCARLTTLQENMFEGANVLTNGRMHIFQGCTSLESIPENLLNNTAKIQSCQDMFSGCTSLKSIPETLLSNYLVSPGDSLEVNVNNMFQGCTGLANIPAGLFDSIKTDNNGILSVDNMFRGCTSLTSIPEGFLDTLAQTRFVTISMNHMFDGCENLTGNAPEYWNVVNQSSITPNGSNCFQGCTNLSNYDSIPENWK